MTHIHCISPSEEQACTGPHYNKKIHFYNWKYPQFPDSPRHTRDCSVLRFLSHIMSSDDS